MVDPDRERLKSLIVTRNIAELAEEARKAVEREDYRKAQELYNRLADATNAAARACSRSIVAKWKEAGR
jgi:protein-arginine kinase activator protein McsA